MILFIQKASTSLQHMSKLKYITQTFKLTLHEPLKKAHISEERTEQHSSFSIKS